jgi:hypothetical protein
MDALRWALATEILSLTSSHLGSWCTTIVIEILNKLERKSRANMQVVGSIPMANNSGKVPAEILNSGILSSSAISGNLQDPSVSIGTILLEYNSTKVELSRVQFSYTYITDSPFNTQTDLLVAFLSAARLPARTHRHIVQQAAVRRTALVADKQARRTPVQASRLWRALEERHRGEHTALGQRWLVLVRR